MAKENTTNDGAFVLTPVIQRYTFAKPLKGDNAREVYNAVAGRVSKDFKNVPAFAQYFKFNEETGEINGSNTFYGILVNDELSKGGLWIPTIVEAKQLEAAGKLTSGVYRENGMAVFNAENPNAQIAKILVKEAAKRGWKTPILAPFKALKIRKGGSDYGVMLGFTDNTQGVMSGEEAESYIQNQINYKTNSGAVGSGRVRDGNWYAASGSLANSGASGRVDFVCGEATAQNLEGLITDEINKVAKEETARINARLSKAREAGIAAFRA